MEGFFKYGFNRYSSSLTFGSVCSAIELVYSYFFYFFIDYSFSLIFIPDISIILDIDILSCKISVGFVILQNFAHLVLMGEYLSIKLSRTGLSINLLGDLLNLNDWNLETFNYSFFGFDYVSYISFKLFLLSLEESYSAFSITLAGVTYMKSIFGYNLSFSISCLLEACKLREKRLFAVSFFFELLKILYFFKISFNSFLTINFGKLI